MALNKAQLDLKNWAGLNVSWFGRCALLKMIILPRFLYLMQTIPIHLPASFFATYKQVCLIFIWIKSPPHIKYAWLTWTKTKGELARNLIHAIHNSYYLLDTPSTLAKTNLGTSTHSTFPGGLHTGGKIYGFFLCPRALNHVKRKSQFPSGQHKLVSGPRAALQRYAGTSLFF